MGCGCNKKKTETIIEQEQNMEPQILPKNLEKKEYKKENFYKFDIFDINKFMDKNWIYIIIFLIIIITVYFLFKNNHIKI